MVLVGGLGAHQLDFRLGVPVGGNSFGLAGRGRGRGACLGARTNISPLGPMAGIAEVVRLGFALEAAAYPAG